MRYGSIKSSGNSEAYDLDTRTYKTIRIASYSFHDSASSEVLVLLILRFSPYFELLASQIDSRQDAVVLLAPVVGDIVLDLLVDVAKDKVMDMISTLAFGDENADAVARIDAVIDELECLEQAMVKFCAGKETIQFGLKACRDNIFGNVLVLGESWSGTHIESTNK
jgi:hypothetical protein